MTDLEKAQHRLNNAIDTLEFVQVCANSDRKLSTDKHMNGHYTKALDELNRIITAEKTLVARLESSAR